MFSLDGKNCLIAITSIGLDYEKILSKNHVEYRIKITQVSYLNHKS